MKQENLSKLPKLLAGLNDKSIVKKVFFQQGIKVKYQQLQDSVAKTRGLFRYLQLYTGDRVVVVSEDKYSVSVLYIACLMEGLTAVIIDPASTVAEVTVLITRVEPKALFMDQMLIDTTQKLRREAIIQNIVPIIIKRNKRTAFSLIIRKKSQEQNQNSYPLIIENQSEIFEELSLPEDTVGLILFTSGTTSKPKGVMLSHLNIDSQLHTLIKKFQLKENSCLVNHLPLHHTDGLNQGPILALAAKATWISTPSVSMKNLGGLLDTVYREKATHLITVPTVLAMMEQLPDEYNDSFSFSEFSFIESTAGKLESDLWRSIEKRFCTTVVNCYGLTETVSEALYSGPDDWSRRIGSIGKPSDCEVRIVNDGGQDVKRGEEGELILRGKNIMLGYFNDTVTTNSVFANGWFKTGDLAYVDKDGYYYIAGRIKNIIIRGGINVSPEEVSSILLENTHISLAVTLGIEDAMLGERVISCIVLTNTSDELTVKEIFTYCREKLAAEKIPNEILLFTDLPYGPSGKVQLKTLQEIVLSRLEKEYLLINNQSVSQNIFELAAKIFHVQLNSLSVRSNSNNTQGWDSLSFLDLIMAIEKSFMLKLQPRDIINIDTLGDAISITKQLTDRN